VHSAVFPSVIWIGPSGSTLIGEVAVRRAVSDPERVAREFKRRFGDATPIFIGSTPYSPESLTAKILSWVVEQVKRREGDTPASVVLTHPVSWGQYKRDLLIDSTARAGIADTVTLINEAEAATIAYAHKAHVEEAKIVLVYDLGGGTFDAAALRRTESGFELLGKPAGIERLGGIDFDEAIFNHVKKALGDELDSLDQSDPAVLIAAARLREDCVAAKETLSSDTEAVIPVLLPGLQSRVRIVRSEFEEMIRPLITETLTTVDRVVASLGSDNLDRVLLVGGSSQIPLVAQMVSGHLQRPVVSGMYPKQLVALGAALATAPAVDSSRPTPAARAPAGAEQSEEPAPAPNDTVTPVTPSSGASSGERAAASINAAVSAPNPTTEASAPSPSVEASGQYPNVEAPGLGRSAEASAPRPDVEAAAPSPNVEASSFAPLTEPGPPPRPPVDGTQLPRQARRRKGLKIALIAAAVLAVMVLASIIRIPTTENSGPQAANPTEPAAAPNMAPSVETPPPNSSTAVAPVDSAAVPSLGNTVPVGQTPTFVVVGRNGRLAFVANANAQTVTVVDTSINKVTAVIPVPDGPPQFLTWSPNGKQVFVSIFNDQRTIAKIDVIDTASQHIITSIPMSTRPFRGAFTKDGRRFYVPNHDSGTVSVIDTATDKVVNEIQVAPNPHWIEFLPDGKFAYIANHEANLVSVLDPNTDKIVAQIPVGTSPHSLAVHPTLPICVNVNYDSNNVTVIDTNTRKVINTIPVGKNPQAIRWAPDGHFAYVVNNGDSTVSVIDAQTWRVTATIPTGQSPTSVGVLPNGTQAYVTNFDAGTLTVLNTGI
jgi:YVTN family beta-propeller protein